MELLSDDDSTSTTSKSCIEPMMIDTQKGQAPLTERVTFLRSLPLFTGLNGEELRFLAGEAQARAYAAGAIICHAGEPGYTCHSITIAGHAAAARESAPR